MNFDIHVTIIHILNVAMYIKRHTCATLIYGECVDCCCCVGYLQIYLFTLSCIQCNKVHFVYIINQFKHNIIICCTCKYIKRIKLELKR